MRRLQLVFNEKVNMLTAISFGMAYILALWVGAAFGSFILPSLSWKRMTRNGDLAGVITGAVTVIIWAKLKGGLFDLYELAPGFLFAGLAIIIISLLDKVPSTELQEQFNTYQSKIKTTLNR
ncbi:hypothetical protein [Peribacillus asahii]|uniref:hypothetical protein n=1 Tax=Peribacillus asahii TaxID=228899 RepID=UPI002079E99F|nr:hypothetical protein [Peribacillus asahii]USK60467.1 hypothetical protein LIT37_03700 [Peribacillus asahii]